MEIDIKNVKYKYQGTKENTLKDINMHIEEGKIVGIIGPNGSGKTTLLEMFYALRYPTEGTIEINSNVLTKESNLDFLRFKIGIAFENPEEQFISGNIKEEFYFKLKYYNYNKTKINQRIVDSLAMVGLDEEILDRSIKNISNSEKKKLSIALSLLLNPDVVVLDEPTLYLLDNDIKKIVKLIKTLKRRYSKTIIIASHNMDFLNQIVDYIYVIDDGKVVLEGGKYDVFKQDGLLKRYNITPPNIIAFENKVLDKKNIRIGYRDEINDLIKDIYRYVN